MQHREDRWMAWTAGHCWPSCGLIWTQDEPVERRMGLARLHPIFYVRHSWILRHVDAPSHRKIRRSCENRSRDPLCVGCDQTHTLFDGWSHSRKHRWDDHDGCGKRRDAREENENDVWLARVLGFCMRRTRSHAYCCVIGDESKRKRSDGSRRDHRNRPSSQMSE